jgi:hypothetical protein
VCERVGECADLKVIAVFAKLSGGIRLAFFDGSEDVLNQGGFSAEAFSGDEQKAFEDNSESSDGEEQNGPHDGAALMEEIEHGKKAD